MKMSFVNHFCILIDKLNAPSKFVKWYHDKKSINFELLSC